jgi:hypothetical protein
MQPAMITLAIVLIAFILVILAKHRQDRDERTRKKELLDQIVKHYDGLSEIDACDVFYVSIIKQIARLKNQNANYEHLRKDANLLLELRNSFIENEVLRDLDMPKLHRVYSLRRISHATHPQFE